MMGQTLTGLNKSPRVDAAIDEFKIVKMGITDDTVAQATAATEELIGVVQDTTTAAGQHTQLAMVGNISRIVLGTGGATRGDKITADANGDGVVPAPGAGVNNNYIGVALKTGVAGDIIPVLIQPGSIQG